MGITWAQTSVRNVVVVWRRRMKRIALEDDSLDNLVVYLKGLMDF